MGDGAGMQRAILAMTEADVDAVHRVAGTGFDAPWTRESLTEELTRSFARVLIAETPTDGVVGYVHYWRVADESEVLNVATLPERRREGHARALIAAVIQETRAEGGLKVLLEVRPSNTAAVGLYTALGFARTHTRKGYYTDGEHAWVMALDLGEPRRP